MLRYSSFQSTHPLGVRLRCKLSIATSTSFNPRTHSGCDLSPIANTTSDDCFNPRTHSGCDRCLHSRKAHRCSFNPRTHSGCDTHAMMMNNPGLLFQSTHPLGVRRGSTKNFTFSEMFQSTHPLGVRHGQPICQCGLLCFNPRTHSGCDLLAANDIAGMMQFQSTHPLGVRHAWRKTLGEAAVVSIHAPTRGATSLSLLPSSLVLAFQSTHPLGVRRCRLLPYRYREEVSIHAPTRGATAYLVID